MIGIGDDGLESLLPVYRQWIEQSEVLVGGERHLAFFPQYGGEKIVIKGGLAPTVERLKEESRSVVMLVSGDPLFYGLGSVLAKKLSFEIYPHTSSVQLAFSKMQESWHDAYLTSVHGRSMKGLAQKIDGRKKVAILTDETNSPNAIATYLKAFGMTEYDAFVAENLAGDNERFGHYTLDEMEQASFSPLNVVILKQKIAVQRSTMGIDDDAFIQRKPEKGLVTKKEIRVLSLHALALQETDVAWDIGTCTGSVAIEMAKQAREGQVYAIEKNELDLQNCIQNQHLHRADLTAIHGKAPERLDEFSDPDAIFIGGTGGNMEQLLEVCVNRLKPNGRIVINLATIENLADAQRILKQLQCDVNFIQASISRSKPILNITRLQPLTPIFILTAKKINENDGE